MNDRKLWDVVDFQPICHVTEATSRVLELIGNKAHFMPTFNEALGELISVCFDSTKLWESKISAD